MKAKQTLQRWSRFLCPAAFLVAVGGGCSPNRPAAPADQAAGEHSDVSAVGAALALPAAPSASGKLFTEVAAAAGFAHRHHKPVLDRQLDNIMSWVCSVGAAAAAGDFDNDGWIDLYVTNSHKGTPNYLYRNNRDGTFTDVAAPAGLAHLNGDAGVSMDCIWGDYDNDGWIDLYLVRWGTDALFRNNGDGTFTDVTARLFKRRDGSPGIDWANGNAAVWLDYNLDGRLDIYVGNYFDEVDLWNLKSTRIMHDDFEKARNAGRNFLYRQNPDGTFSQVAHELGLDDPGWTLAVGAADLNDDGWPDIYCADDFGPDQLFLSNGDGTFRNVSESVIGADTKKGMNVDFGDFDNDGLLDIFVTNITTAEYLQEGNMLWRNQGVSAGGDVVLTDVSMDAGTFDGGWGWGSKFFDSDNDGDLDLVSANGFISAGAGNYWYDLASWSVLGQDPAEAKNWPAIGDRSFSGYERERFWRNDGMGSFTERAAEVGLETDRDGRGVVCFDYDNDGDLDVFIANQNQAPNLFRNDARAGNHWLTIALQADPATKTNRDAVGARVTVSTKAGRQMRERDGGNSYCGQSDPRVHFGLGKAERADWVEVRWPDGGTQRIEDVAVDQRLTIRQDPARYVRGASPGSAIGSRRSPDAGIAASEDKPATNAPAAAADAGSRIGALEAELAAGPAAFHPASEYRALCAKTGRHDRAIAFFEKQVEARPDDARGRIELSLAYVDKIPTCGGMAAIVSKGTLARKGLDQLDAVIAQAPDSWLAHYCRAMNHLHWPRSLRHSDDAAADFVRCLELQKAGPVGATKPHQLRIHVGLGDAYAKDKRYDQARRAWREGQSLYPDSAELRERLAIADDGALLRFVELRRSLESPLDTGLSFMDAP